MSSVGLSTTNGEIPHNGCTVKELIQGTDPVSGHFQLCMDTIVNHNNVMSVKSKSCTDLIRHNAPATREDSNSDGSSVEEKLESMDNIGDISVSRGAINIKNGGFTWTITFLRDADGPCEQKDDFSGQCNSPGNVP